MMSEIVEKIARCVDPDQWTIIDRWSNLKGTPEYDSRVDDYRKASLDRASALLGDINPLIRSAYNAGYDRYGMEMAGWTPSSDDEDNPFGFDEWLAGQ